MERKNDGVETPPHKDGGELFRESRRGGKKKRRRKNATARGREGNGKAAGGGNNGMETTTWKRRCWRETWRIKDYTKIVSKDTTG